MSITQMKRDTVYARDERRCASCGRWDALSLQHRRRKGMGGVKGAAALVADGYANLVTLCIYCNVALEQDATFAATGNRCGWRLLAGEQAGAVAVWIMWAREWRRLLDDGTAVPVVGRDPESWELAA